MKNFTIFFMINALFVLTWGMNRNKSNDAELSLKLLISAILRDKEFLAIDDGQKYGVLVAIFKIINNHFKQRTA
jgi:hypothetical protein